jgi:uncharacterized membrane protein YidH (DUF202 family)
MSGPGTPGSPADDMEDADPALAKERTELAWTRSSISFAALGLLILKFRPAFGVPVLLFSAVVWWAGHMRRDAAGTASRRVLLVTVAVIAMAFVALLLIVLGHGSRGLRL